ncbi:hypothetical protein ERJ75_000464200 [Trypanosoma vivax]|uniref:Uncharacterized protein n=1 Tax=Trypanosoma vivax (strain Y486) TaxID=1055687 RepID=G0U591_TRYVY|nr:hypothetical protein TRVL_04005 [Trypanosoma vivax]KAH8616638.1 hypothetical protein ERJ75_000464200 [Trypanosoma vivax]CCC51039.1 conserved hypothetical protein [Trypanosoma vivax Y486]
MESADDLGETTTVTVSVAGTTSVPLHLKVLESLQDASLQEEIKKEAVRLALVEKLGGFGGVSVVSANMAGEVPAYEAQLKLADLCSLISVMKDAHKQLETRLQQLNEAVSVFEQQLEAEKESEKINGAGDVTKDVGKEGSEEEKSGKTNEVAQEEKQSTSKGDEVVLEKGGKLSTATVLASVRTILNGALDIPAAEPLLDADVKSGDGLQRACASSGIENAQYNSGESDNGYRAISPGEGYEPLIDSEDYW